MNPVIETILKRKSVRAYEKKAIDPKVREELLQATLRAPTAGNLMLYSIVEVSDQHIKNKLVKTCDNQPFIARAPLVWLFLADYQRWFDYFLTSGVEQLCEQNKTPMRKPEEGDLFLACCDALIAAQTAVIAAESLGLGSCYIGDIMENYAAQRPVRPAEIRLPDLPGMLRLPHPPANGPETDHALPGKVHLLRKPVPAAE